MSTNPNSQVNPDDFTEEQHAAVDAMAAPIIEGRRKNLEADSHFHRKNRMAHKRMNRPEKLDRMDKGAKFTLDLIDRGLKVNQLRSDPSTDAEGPQ